MPSTSKGSPPTSATNDVTAAIRQAILRGEFVPQQRLVEVDLCEQFGVSRAAVRNALLNLATEGLVERLPNRGARIRAISLDEAIEIVEARSALESLCARKAAAHITPASEERLREFRAGIASALDAGDFASYSALHQELDSYIRELSGHQTAASILERLQAQGARHQFRLSFKPGRVAKSGPEHLRIIDALLANDADEAEAATVAHLGSVMDALRESF